MGKKGMYKKLWWGNYLENVYMKDREKDKSIGAVWNLIRTMFGGEFQRVFEAMEIKLCI
jgi:hypothetical protein